MKKVSFIFIFFAITFASCTKNEDTKSYPIDFTYTVSGLTVSFNITQSSPKATKFHWYIVGDNIYEKNPTYTFPSIGTYEVILWQYEGDNLAGNVEKTITINTFTKTFTVSASSDTKAEGVYLKSGNKVNITATGNWCYGSDRCCGPNGTSGSYDQACIIPSAYTGKLIGSYDSNGFSSSIPALSYFEIGSSYSFSPKYEGTFFMTMNDWKTGRTGNTGTVSVTVTVSQ